jgi:plasmid stabilization system protein ParE
MAGKLIWSPASRDDLRDIVRFIARDNPRRAESFAYQLMARTDVLQHTLRLVVPCLSIAIRESARLFFGRIGLFTVLIMRGSWWRSRAYGTQREALLRGSF